MADCWMWRALVSDDLALPDSTPVRINGHVHTIGVARDLNIAGWPFLLAMQAFGWPIEVPA